MVSLSSFIVFHWKVTEYGGKFQIKKNHWNILKNSKDMPYYVKQVNYQQ